MQDHDLELRNVTYRLFVELGRAPTVDEAAEAAGLTRAEVEDGWRRLHDEGSSFRAVKDALRRNLALARLETTRKSIAGRSPSWASRLARLG